MFAPLILLLLRFIFPSLFTLIFIVGGVQSTQSLLKKPESFSDIPSTSSCIIPELCSSRNTPEYMKYFNLSLLPSRFCLEDNVFPFDFSRRINYDTTKSSIYFALNDLNIRALKRLLDTEELVEDTFGDESEHHLVAMDKSALVNGGMVYEVNSLEHSSVWDIIFQAPSDSLEDLQEIMFFLLKDIGTCFDRRIPTLILNKLLNGCWSFDYSALTALLKDDYFGCCHKNHQHCDCHANLSYDPETFLPALQELLRYFPKRFSGLFELVRDRFGQPFIQEYQAFVWGAATADSCLLKTITTAADVFSCIESGQSEHVLIDAIRCSTGLPSFTKDGLNLCEYFIIHLAGRYSYKVLAELALKEVAIKAHFNYKAESVSSFEEFEPNSALWFTIQEWL